MAIDHDGLGYKCPSGIASNAEREKAKLKCMQTEYICKKN
jgi:hypothetical protein